LLWAAAPLGVSGIVSSIYLRFDFLFLRGVRGGDEAGLYYAAQRAYDYSLFIPQAFITMAFPVLVGHLAVHRERAVTGMQRSFDFLLLAGVPLAVGVGVLAPKVIRFLYDPAFVKAMDALRPLYVAAIFSYLTSFFAYVLIALNRQRDALGVNALVLALNVTLNLYAIPRWGMIGAAYCMLATEVFSFACTSGLVRRRYGFYPDLRRIPSLLLAAGVMGAALAWLADQGLRLWALAPIGMVLYGALALALRLVDRETLIEILRMRRPQPGKTGRGEGVSG
jgi:O-antigen/teichoic acid export membrane protein